MSCLKFHSGRTGDWVCCVQISWEAPTWKWTVSMCVNTVFLKWYLIFWAALVHRHSLHRCLMPQGYLMWWTCTLGQVPVLGKGRILRTTCLKVALIIILLGQLACRNHHEVHCCDCIRTEKHKFKIQLKKVRNSKVNGRSKNVHPPFNLAGLMHALMDNNYNDVFMS